MNKAYLDIIMYKFPVSPTGAPGVYYGSHLTGAPKKFATVETQRGAFTLREWTRSWRCLDLIFQLFLLFNLWMAPKQDPKPKFQEGKTSHKKATSCRNDTSVHHSPWAEPVDAGAASAQWRVCTALYVCKQTFSPRNVNSSYYKIVYL